MSKASLTAILLAGIGFCAPAAAQPVDGLVISEVFYDAAGADDGLEWIELYNGFSAPVELCEYRLAWAGLAYEDAQVQLDGTVAPGTYFVVGGPTSSALNGNPVFDLVLNFDPDLQNSGTTADAIALFHLGYEPVTSSDIPVDAVIYGEANGNLLIDETGNPGSPDVADAPSGQSIERLDAFLWQVQATPTPGTGSLVFGGGTPPAPVECDPPLPPMEDMPFDSLEVSFRVDFASFGSVLDPVFIDTVLTMPGLEIGERLAGQTLYQQDPDGLQGDPTAPVEAAAGAAGLNLSMMTRPPEPGGINILFGATISSSITGLGGSVGLVFAEDQSEMGLELYLYGGGDLKASFYRRDGTSLGVVISPLPDTPYDTPHAVAFRHRDGVAEIAAMTAEFIPEVGHGFGIEAIVIAMPVAGVSDDQGIPAAFRLVGNHPNPFNPRTTISFGLDRGGWARMGIYDLAGRRVTVLTERTFSAGEHDLVWDGTDDAGHALPSGTYIVRLETLGGVQAGKVMLIR
jgi:hypothetical protein